MASQHPAPARMGTQVVSAPPLAQRTIHKAVAAPTQTGSSKIAMMVLHHFGTRDYLGAGSRFATSELGNIGGNRATGYDQSQPTNHWKSARGLAHSTTLARSSQTPVFRKEALDFRL